MKETKEVSYKKLKYVCNPDIFNFVTTEELERNYNGIGQERGINSLKFGLNVDVNGYNLYLEGPSGVGKTMYTKNYLTQISKNKKVPPDWCYVYNFENPNEPVAINFPAGQGSEFKEAMERFVKDIRVEIKSTFTNNDFEKEKNIIIQKYQDKRAKLLENLNAQSSKYGFQVKASESGIYMMAVVDGKVVKEEEFDKLDDSIKQEYEEKSTIVQSQIMDAIEQIKVIEKQSDKKISEWQSNIALLTINVHINYLKSKFKRNKKIYE